MSREEDDERQDLVDEIEMLYPPDANEDGPALLMLAFSVTWRDLPMVTLRELARLNIQKDHRGI